MRKRKRIIAGLAAAAAAAMIGGTWAVWSQHLLTKNEFMTAKYSTFLQEEFQAPDKWLPGEEEKKAVWVKNESTIPIIAKITMNQDWIRRENVTAYLQATPGSIPKEEIVAEEGESLPVIFDGAEGKEFAAVLNFNRDSVVVLADSRNEEPGLRLDIPEVQTLEEAKGKWLLESECPNEYGNYTFYYMGLVEPGEQTPVLLSGVTMNPQLETTVTGSYTYFVEDPEAEGGYRKVTMDVTNSKYGYDSSHFTLNVNMQTVQATKDAVDTILSKDRVTEYIAGYIAGDGVYESTSVKKLYFEEKRGIMSYTPYRTPDGGVEEGNWFMSFTNMVPGGIYKDKLLIHNQSNKRYSLYMRIVPRDGQTVIQDELLKKIAMKVYYFDQIHDGELIYDGDATGFHYSDENGDVDMQGLVPLGLYRRGSQGEIHVELMLDPELGLNDDGTYKYADVLTKIDWEFMVQQRSGGGGNTPGGGGSTPGGPGDPTTIGDGEVPLSDLVIPENDIPLAALARTGDEGHTMLLAAMAAMSLLLLVFAGAMFKKSREEE